MSAVCYEKTGHCGIVTVNREQEPPADGSFFWKAMKEVTEAIGKDQEIYAVVFGGAGSALLPAPGEKDGIPSAWKEQLAKLKVPIIAAFSDPGTDCSRALARACDISIASASTDEAATLVVEEEKLWETAVKLAEQICANAPIAVQQIKRCVNVGLETEPEVGLEFEQQAFAVCNATEDKKTGMRAFLNKEGEKHFLAQ